MVKQPKEPKRVTPEQLAASGTEHGHQSALFCWAAEVSDRYFMLRTMFAIPNGGAREAVTAGRLKAEGVKAGVPDIFLPYPTNDQWGHHFSGLFIEMKVAPNKPTEAQDKFLATMTAQGYACVVCYSWQQARDCILGYVGVR